jgi:hypothetical protein
MAENSNTDLIINPSPSKDAVYIGTILVRATPMNSDEFAKEQKQRLSYVGVAEGYKIVYEDGYISWSPRDVFERCYRPLTREETNMIIQ